MKQSDRAILIGVAVVVLLAGFWFMVVSPKREEASKLSDEIATLQAEVSEQESTISLATDARSGYKRHYRDLVVLGRAAPADADTPSLITQLQGMADRADVGFGTLELNASAGSVDIAAQAPTTPDPAAAPAEGETEEPAESETSTTAAVPTEASTALLPLGASVGPAGLPVMPYNVTISGGFFQTADFLAQIDALVHHQNGEFEIDGRLFTVNGFTMSSPTTAAGNDDLLSVDLQLTTYLVPESQGVTGGATADAPAATVPEATTTAAAPGDPAS